jgi:FAD/FMN-containing dehydrogenase
VAVEGAAEFPSPMAAIAFFHMHGAAARVAPDATAFALRRNQWDANVVSQWTEPQQSELQIAWVRRVWERMEPLTSGGAYLNHLAGDDRPEKVRASYGSNYERLAALKRKYDPENLFRLNANIRPSG